MLKYYDIVSKLSDEDKIKILSDINVLSDVRFKALGIPSVKSVGIDELGASKYPKQTMLANTWNISLIGQVAEDCVCRAADVDAGIIYVEGPRLSYILLQQMPPRADPRTQTVCKDLPTLADPQRI